MFKTADAVSSSVHYIIIRYDAFRENYDVHIDRRVDVNVFVNFNKIGTLSLSLFNRLLVLTFNFKFNS